MKHSSNLYGDVFHYIETHLLNQRWYGIVSGSRIVAHYAPLIEHMLIDANLIPGRGKTLSQCITALFSGKRVVEIGCRAGIFLKFAREHGAIVAGSTGDPFYVGAKGFLGRNALLFKSKAEQAGNSKRLQLFKPDILVSFNLFDKGRWPGGKAPLEKILPSFAQIASEKTLIYVAPSVDNGTLLRKKDLGQFRLRNLTYLRKHHEGKKRHWRDITFRFRFRKQPEIRRRL